MGETILKEIDSITVRLTKSAPNTAIVNLPIDLLHDAFTCSWIASGRNRKQIFVARLVGCNLVALINAPLAQRRKILKNVLPPTLFDHGFLGGELLGANRSFQGQYGEITIVIGRRTR